MTGRKPDAAKELSGGYVEGVNVDAVHDAVAGCPGVAGLGSSPLGSFATYLPGRRVPGVRVTADAVELEIRAAWESSAPDIAECVRSALATIAPGRRVDVSIVDIEVPGGDDEEPGESAEQAEPRAIEAPTAAPPELPAATAPPVVPTPAPGPSLPSKLEGSSHPESENR